MPLKGVPCVRKPQTGLIVMTISTWIWARTVNSHHTLEISKLHTATLFLQPGKGLQLPSRPLRVMQLVEGPIMVQEFATWTSILSQ